MAGSGTLPAKNITSTFPLIQFGISSDSKRLNSLEQWKCEVHLIFNMSVAKQA
jgi:hypothetical protein